jgi:hypothetical protein
MVETHVCNKEEKDAAKITNAAFDSAKCQFHVTVESDDACTKKQLNKIWAFLNKFGYIFAALVIIVGGFLNLFGTRYKKTTLFIISFFTAAFLIFVSS